VIKDIKRMIVGQIYNSVMDYMKRQPGFKEWLYGPDFDSATRNAFYQSLRDAISKAMPRATQR